MRLYSGTSDQFIDDTTHNLIADKLKAAFFNYFHYNPSLGEINSWENSLRAISLVFQRFGLLDHGVLLEYQLPSSSKRLDCLICGKDIEMKDNAVIIELKQWQECELSEGEGEVLTWLSGKKRNVLHPSVQVGQYKQYLQDYHSAFYEGGSPVNLNACAYLHNYSSKEGDVIFSKKFTEALAKYPLFLKTDVERLRDFLLKNLQRGGGKETLMRIEKSRYKPSDQLMEHVAEVINGLKEYTLLDEQKVVYDMILSAAKNGLEAKEKRVIIVEGGPGTGKSVIALNLMRKLSCDHFNTHYVTGSRAFTSTLRKILGKRNSLQLKYFNGYTTAQENEVDVLLADEAHRLWHLDKDRFKRKEELSDKPIVEQLIRASKVSVFFVDNLQIIRPNEVGSSSYIEEHATKCGTVVSKYKLDVQFRCKGSDAFVNWIDNTLGIERTANVIWTGEESFDFKIFKDPGDLEIALRKKAEEGKTARMTAGFCWKWSDPKEDGTLTDDVVIGDFKRPWNAKSGKNKLAHGIPVERLWALDPNGINQIGCIYTAQGFEFDYVGVIFGGDLFYNFDSQAWEGHPENSRDPIAKRSKGKFTEFVKNTYRVLLSRGIEGAYVCFLNRETEKFVRSRIDKLKLN
ncbi:MAG: DUF2075 domain-containing protein [Thermoplasmataceae archaeon]